MMLQFASLLLVLPQVIQTFQTPPHSHVLVSSSEDFGVRVAVSLLDKFFKVTKFALAGNVSEGFERLNLIDDPVDDTFEENLPDNLLVDIS